MKKRSPGICSKIARTLPHRKAKRLYIPKYISRIKCRKHSFRVTRKVKQVIKGIKHTFENVRTPSPCNKRNISIQFNRVYEYREKRGNVRVPFRHSFSDDFLKHRTINMVDSSLSTTGNRFLPNITITFDKILEIRKKRWNKKYNKKSLSSSVLRNSVIEIDDSDNILPVTNEENNLNIIVENNSGNVLSDLNIKENNDISGTENVLQNESDSNINEQQNLEFSNNLYEDIETSSSFSEENSIIIIDDLVEQPISVSEIDLTKDFTNSCFINKECVKKSVNGVISDNVLKENNKNTNNTNLLENKINNRIGDNLLQNDFEVIEIDDSNISMSASLGDVNCDQTSNTVTSSKIPICTSDFIPLISSNGKRKRSSNSVVAVANAAVHDPDLDNSDIIFVGVSKASSPKRKRRKLKSRLLNKPNKQQNPNVAETPTIPTRVTRRSERLQTTNNQQPFENGDYQLSSQNQMINNNQYTTHTNIPFEPPFRIPYFNNNHYLPSFDTNICNIGMVRRSGLREIIIDGSNIALGHSNGTVFSVKGLVIAINYFLRKGHKVTTFVPQYRSKSGQCTDPQQLVALNKSRLVIFTPSREVNGRRITPYDDRYIIQYANSCEGIVVSNDNFRDILQEKPQWKHTIERRILMYTWVDDVLIFPEDPLGRRGPNLEQFLRFP